MATKRRANNKSVEKLHAIARLLVDAASQGDALAAAKHGVSPRTVRRYRAFAENGTGREALLLTQIVQEKRNLVDADFSDSLRTAIHELLGFLSRSAVSLDPSNPAATRVVAGALKMATNSYERILLMDARLAGRPPVELVPLKAVKPAQG